MKINTQSSTYRWAIFVPSLVIIAIAIAYSVYWFNLASNLRRNIDDWIADQNQQGYAISYETLDISGYPFRLHIDLNDVTVSEPGHPNDWTWNAEHVVGLTLPYKLNQIILELRGAQRIDYIENLGPVARAPHRYTVTASAKAARSSLVFSKRKLKRLSIDVTKLNAVRQGPDGEQTLKAERLQMHTRPAVSQAGMTSSPPASGLDLFVQADALVLPYGDDFTSHPASPIDAIKINMVMPDMDSAVINSSSLASWAEKGGHLEIVSSHIIWDQINIAASGALHLDAQNRIEGEVSTLIGGYDQFVTLLVDSGAFDKNTGALVSSGLGLLAAFNGDGQGRIKTPVRFEQGEIFLGPVKVGSMGPVISPYN